MDPPALARFLVEAGTVDPGALVARIKAAPPRPRCPAPGCSVRYRGGADQLCPAHQGGTGPQDGS